MLKKSMIIRDPLKLLGLEADETLAGGGCGAILARAGVGKTALLVQLAITSLLQEKRVLHVSLKDPVDKVDLWYKEVFNNMSKMHDLQSSNRLWDEMLPYRFILAFESSAFSLDRLMRKVEELRSQDIFAPQTIVIDGYSLNEAQSDDLTAFKDFTRSNALTTWFTIRGHRGKEPTPDAFAEKFARDYDDFFDAILQLYPDKDQIQVKPMKTEAASHPLLFLDPSTLLIRENRA